MRRAVVWLLLLLCLSGTALGEGISYYSDYNGLHFTLPEGWKEIKGKRHEMFEGPMETGGLLVIDKTGFTVEELELMDFDSLIVEKWMQDAYVFSAYEFASITPIFFSKTIDEDGKLYALSMCSFTLEGLPPEDAYLYLQMYFTASDGIVGAMSMFTVAVEDDPFVEWFDKAVMENIPEDIMAKLSE